MSLAKSQERIVPLRERIIAMFVGGAIGDGFGVPVETMTEQEISARFGRFTDYLDPTGHKWYDGWAKGRWSDDTQLRITIAESLTAYKRIYMKDLVARHLLASHETVVGWGGSTREATARLQAGDHWVCAGTPEKKGTKLGKGNGVAMKLDPVGAWIFATKGGDPDAIYPMKDTIRNIAIMTHRTDMAIASALAHVAAIQAALDERVWNIDFADRVTRAAVIGERSMGLNYNWDETEFLSERLAKLRMFKHCGPLSNDAIRKLFGSGSSYVYESLPVAYAFYLGNIRSIDSLYRAAYFGGDTDTIASMVGALLGAKNGMKVFPEHLVNGLWRKERIFEVANKFCDAFGIE